MRPACRVCLALVVLCSAAIRLSAREFDPRDLQHEILVREALAKDPRLQPLNLIVRVKDRVATLSGPVPSRELAQRAMETAKKLTELREVQDKMLVQFEDAGLLLPVPVKTQTVVPPGMMRPPPASIPASVPEPKKVVIPTSGVWLPVNGDLQKPPVGVALLPWATAQQGVTEAVSRPMDSGSVVPSNSSIASAVQSLLQADERYRRVRFELKEGKVYFSGAVVRWSDLEQLARAVTHIPGVVGVVLADVQTGRSEKQ